jgi:hypothetical protein
MTHTPRHSNDGRRTNRQRVAEVVNFAATANPWVWWALVLVFLAGAMLCGWRVFLPGLDVSAEVLTFLGSLFS